MSCLCSPEPPEGDDQLFLQQKLLSDAIDRSLITQDQGGKPVRMILLGTGESGKSTVLKQMKILHSQPFTNLERRQYANVIWVDLLESMKKLVFNARKLHIPLDCDQPGSSLIPYKRVIVDSKGLSDSDATDSLLTEKFNITYQKHYSRARYSKHHHKTGGLDIDDDESNTDNETDALASVHGKKKSYSREDIAEAISKLWHEDSGIKKCFEMSNRFQLESSMAYFFDQVHQFLDPKHMCSDHDIIMGRIKTTGITENDFAIKNINFKVLDAGGQRSERKKWIHCFQDLDAVVFVLAVLEYDQTLYEDDRVNRLEESFALFDALCNSRWFRNTPFIIFLNKVDLLKEKLPRSPIKEYLPEYTGDTMDANSVIDFLEKGLLALNKTQKPIYVHRTCATDTKAMGFVISAVTDMLIQQNLKKSGIM